MKEFKSLTKEELLQLKEELELKYKEAKEKNLKLDMSRGKPSPAQLDMGMGLMDALNSNTVLNASDGTDCRNYGILDGLPESKRLMAQIMEAEPHQVMVLGNASLPIMYDTVSRSMTHGVCGSTPWYKLDKIKFLCPVPGYDRHFAITEYFGIEMINIPMTLEGPDMDMVEELVNNDPTVKGIWCVPKYSNPQGISYSDETVRRFASLNPAAEDFRIYWDNAYAVHHLYDEVQDHILNIITECEKAGNPDMVFMFASTSKISFSGSGIAAVAASQRNLDWMRESITLQTIGYDKINQLRHVKYFKDIEGIKAHMKKHADIMRPKFEAVLSILEKNLGGLGIGSWIAPHGGYFISFEAMEGCAKAIVAKCREAGITLTGAGATYPYKHDPKDSNIRIAPSFPSPEEMAAAAEIFSLCVKLVSVEKLLEQA
ncbi:MAG: aminotransferase class I/II-fold pyridoxal phosphate-dependent enzyme [Lachnospiraceae bacterium]|nr:aminotransferase class I/II-fold pyridoxal phosphate-dependent enzyme [Lachnospiraceae bacterium]